VSPLPAPGLVQAASSGPVAWLVELEEPGAAVAWAEVVEEGRPVGPPTRGALARARAAAESRLLSIAAAQEAVAPALARLGGREIYRVRRALNGIAVLATPAQAAAFRRVGGVKSVRPIQPEVPHNRTSVPFLGAPLLWQSTTPVPAGLTGQGVRIGIIDTGIDYLHGDFGGTGLLADYQQAAADSSGWTTNPGSGPGRFPTSKVAGGWDFAGDAYTGAGTPAPDPNPMDCQGHGSHVAGTAAGFGVTAAGATYTGAYNRTDPYSTPPRIGPGVAPEATLYALRVFGCSGGTTLTAQALDWAIDPDGDGDFSDRLDVVNLSLGSDYGHPNDVTAEASDNAARAGVVVVASAGNSGDTYFVSGSPGVAGRAISVANSLDDGKGALLQVNAPASLAGDFPAGAAAFGPNLADGSVTGDVVLVNDGTGTVTDGCQALVGFPAGAVALVDGGGCSFKTKTLNAQNAGAIAAIAVWTAGGGPPLLGDDPTITTPITIPTVSVASATADAIKAALASEAVGVTLLAAGDSLNALSSRGPRAGVPIRLKPDVAAPGTLITSAQSGRVSSGYVPGSASTILSGTSMAAPHVAGLVALLRQLHPGWTVEQLKALVMNHALHDVSLYSGGLGLAFGAGRAGAGRVDAARSMAAELVAYGLDERGLVSVSFDGEVAGVVQRTRSVMVVNHGSADAHLALGLVPSVDAPGVSFSVPGSSTLTVPAGGFATFGVRMTADAAQMDFSADPTVAAMQGGRARSRLSEEAAYLTFTAGSPDGVLNDGGPQMRLPLYAALRPASAMEAAGPIETGGAATGAGTVTLAGSGLCTGTATPGVCTGAFPADRASLVSAFELQGASAKDPSLAGTDLASSDLRYAGVQYDPANGVFVFAVSTWESWATPAQVAFSIVVDGDADGADDKVLMNVKAGDAFLGATGDYVAGASVSSTYYVNLLSPASIDTGLWGSNVLMVAATPAEIGVTVGQPFRWRVVSCPGYAPSCALPPAPYPVDSMGPFTWSTAAQGLDFGGAWALDDQPGSAIPVAWNVASLAAHGSLGALLVHHHNGEGTRAEPVLVQTDAVTPPSSADLAVALALPVSLIQSSTTATMTVSVSNAGPAAASGLAVHVPLPGGLAYVSHAGGGTYDPATGVWTVGALEVAAAQELSVTFEGRAAGTYTLLGEVMTATPLDPRPGDDRATAALTVREAGETAPGGFFTVLPCRAIDTRGATGTWGGPALAAQEERVFPMVGRCGIPPTARAVALNLTVTAPTGNGSLRVYDASLSPPSKIGVLSFSAGDTRANNAVVELSPAGEIAVFNAMASGTTHLVLDVVGYFE
jgi:subtilisin family serine protease